MLQPLEFVDVADSDFLIDSEPVNDDDESDSEYEIEKYFVLAASKSRLFGRKKPLHVVLGAGIIADIILWRDKNVSASILAGISIIWFLFEGLGYNLLTFICHSLLLLLTTLFLWTSLALSTNLPNPPELSDLTLPEGLLANAALSMRYDLTQGFRTFRVISTGQDLKTFILVTVTLWSLSVAGSWFSFVTLFYIVSVILLIVPMLYEKHEDLVDIIAEKALAELNKQYAEFMKKF